MWRKILIINLLLMLALQPVAQAIGPVVSRADSGEASQDMSMMDCGQLEHNHCVDHDNCASGSHSSCDSKSRMSSSVPLSIRSSSKNIYSACSTERYSSHHTERLLRPPRNT
jgi:hypothetical protein